MAFAIFGAIAFAMMMIGIGSFVHAKEMNKYADATTDNLVMQSVFYIQSIILISASLIITAILTN